MWKLALIKKFKRLFTLVAREIAWNKLGELATINNIII